LKKQNKLQSKLFEKKSKLEQILVKMFRECGQRCC
jgi:hypothetical protein